MTNSAWTKKRFQPSGIIISRPFQELRLAHCRSSQSGSALIHELCAPFAVSTRQHFLPLFFSISLKCYAVLPPLPLCRRKSWGLFKKKRNRKALCFSLDIIISRGGGRFWGNGLAVMNECKKPPWQWILVWAGTEGNEGQSSKDEWICFLISRKFSSLFSRATAWCYKSSGF